jgi:aquaporin Z
VSGRDAACYTFYQLAGGLAGAGVVALVLRSGYLDPQLLAAATRPGPAREGVAFLDEAAITFMLIPFVLSATYSPRLAPYTGLVVGLMAAVYFTVEDPLSGMSMNPARSFAQAVVGGTWDGLWVYFAAPPLGMLLAAQLYVRRKGRAAVRCAKMDHDDSTRCIFCEYHAARPPASRPPAGAGETGATADAGHPEVRHAV